MTYLPSPLIRDLLEIYLGSRPAASSWMTMDVILFSDVIVRRWSEIVVMGTGEREING